jgi:hypothetical protein
VLVQTYFNDPCAANDEMPDGRRQLELCFRKPVFKERLNDKNPKLVSQPEHRAVDGRDCSAWLRRT